MGPLRTNRFWSLTRILGITAGKNALRSSLPLYSSVGIGACVLFAGNGLDARTVVELATERRLFGLTLTLLWVLVTLPVARALLGSPETFFLRALPVARFQFIVVLGAGLLIAYIPWAVLWARGAGTSAALAATLTALAIEVHVIAGFRSGVDVARFVLAVIALGLAPSFAALLAATPAFLLGLWQAWVRAPEPRAAGRHSISARSRPLALASALGVSVYRGHASVMLRALLFASASAVFVVLGLGNNQVSDPNTITRVALMVWGPACVFGAVGIAGAVLSAEANARWLFDVCGVSERLRSASAAGLLGTCALVLGGAHGAVVGEALALGARLRLLLMLENAAAGAAWAALAMSIVRATRTGGGRDSGRLLLVMSGLGVVSAVLLAVEPVLTIVLTLGLAVALAGLPERKRADA